MSKSLFEEQGYLVLEGFLSDQEVETLKNRMSQLVDEEDIFKYKSVFSSNTTEQHSDDHFFDSMDKIRFFLEKDADASNEKIHCLNKVGHAIHDCDDTFRSITYQKKIYDLLVELGQAEPSILSSMYIFKPPYIGGEVLYHQDAAFLLSTPQSQITLWFALDDATTENGCIHLIPGKHKDGLVKKFVRQGNDTVFIDLAEENWPIEDAIPVEAKAGTLLVMHGLLPHASEKNLSDHQRHAYILNCIDADTHYHEDNWLQRPDSNPFLKMSQVI